MEGTSCDSSSHCRDGYPCQSCRSVLECPTPKMCHLSPQDQHVCQSNHGIAEAVTGVLGRAQFPSCSFYHPRSSRSRFRPTRKAAICAGNFPDSNGNTFAKIGRLERASVVELLSTTTTTHNLREAPHGHFSTFPMPPTPCDGDNPAPIPPDCWGPAGHDRACHDVGPVPVGWSRGQLSDRATLFLHGDTVGHAVLGVLSSASVPSRGCLPPSWR